MPERARVRERRNERVRAITGERVRERRNERVRAVRLRESARERDGLRERETAKTATNNKDHAANKPGGSIYSLKSHPPGE